MNASELWSNDDAPTPEVTMEEIVTRAARLRRKVRLSLALEFGAGAFVVVAFVAMAAVPGFAHLPTLSRIGAALIACAAIFVLTYLGLRSKASPDAPRHLSTLACYRADLDRRRALLASAVRWYLAPFWPGLFSFFAGFMLAHRDDPAAVRAGVFSIAFAVAVNLAIAVANRRAARKLAVELAALPVEEGD